MVTNSCDADWVAVGAGTVGVDVGVTVGSGVLVGVGVGSLVAVAGGVSVGVAVVAVAVGVGGGVVVAVAVACDVEPAGEVEVAAAELGDGSVLSSGPEQAARTNTATVIQAMAARRCGIAQHSISGPECPAWVAATVTSVR
jgi:hypothetical protein